MTVLARDIMTPQVKAVPQSWTMQRLARFLTDNEITGSPVSDDAGNIVGIVTLKDIADFHWNSVDSGNEERLSDEDRQEARRLRQFLFEEMARTPVEVRDIMTPSVVSVDELTKVTDISDLMMYEHLHRVFVRRAGDIVGIVTTYDMLKVISDPVLTGRLWRTDD